METIKRFLDENPKATLKISELAAMVHLSESRFKQKFKEYFGVSTIMYHNKIKIEYAKKELARGKKIISIANELGFSSSQHFASCFKQYTTYSASDYKKRMKRP